jgi:hypothetical protein
MIVMVAGVWCSGKEEGEECDLEPAQSSVKVISSFPLFSVSSVDAQNVFDLDLVFSFEEYCFNGRVMHTDLLLKKRKMISTQVIK